MTKSNLPLLIALSYFINHLKDVKENNYGVGDSRLITLFKMYRFKLYSSPKRTILLIFKDEQILSKELFTDSQTENAKLEFLNENEKILHINHYNRKVFRTNK